MTNVSTGHPSYIPSIELLEKGLKISFNKDCLGEIKIRRKVNDEEWKVLVEGAFSPFVDNEAFPAGTKLSYLVELQLNGESKRYKLDARL